MVIVAFSAIHTLEQSTKCLKIQPFSFFCNIVIQKMYQPDNNKMSCRSNWSLFHTSILLHKRKPSDLTRISPFPSSSSSGNDKNDRSHVAIKILSFLSLLFILVTDTLLHYQSGEASQLQLDFALLIDD